MASYPTFDPPGLANGISQAECGVLSPKDATAAAPFINRAIQGQYAPGSTWKLVTADAALRTGLHHRRTTPTTTPGTYTIPVTARGRAASRRNAGPDAVRAGRRPPGAHRVERRVLLQPRRTTSGSSADAASARTPSRTSPPCSASATATGVAAAGGAATAGCPPRSSKRELHEEQPEARPRRRWFAGDNVNLAIGQGEMLVTPIQLANAYATYANGGTRYPPNVALRVQQPGRRRRRGDRAARPIAPARPAARRARRRSSHGLARRRRRSRGHGRTTPSPASRSTQFADRRQDGHRPGARPSRTPPSSSASAPTPTPGTRWRS